MERAVLKELDEMLKIRIYFWKFKLYLNLLLGFTMIFFVCYFQFIRKTVSFDFLVLLLLAICILVGYFIEKIPKIGYYEMVFSKKYLKLEKYRNEKREKKLHEFRVYFLNKVLNHHVKVDPNEIILLEIARKTIEGKEFTEEERSNYETYMRRNWQRMIFFS